jgi:hypothetical protein
VSSGFGVGLTATTAKSGIPEIGWCRGALSIKTSFDQKPNGGITRWVPKGKPEIVDAFDELGIKDQVDERPGCRHVVKCSDRHNSYYTIWWWCTIKDSKGVSRVPVFRDQCPGARASWR